MAEPRPALPAAAASAPSQQLAPVVITGARVNDIQERRLSTAAKIVVGRDEIERYGDSTIGETLKRLPGVTVGGAPGRGGGGVRMRGLGSGYTLILLDGQRVPPGFSIESLEPDQVERIEVLRAPTAETGARAIAGVINIVTREGFRKRLNNLRVGTGFENGHFQPGISWTRNDTVDDLIYNFSLSASRNDRRTDSVTTEELTDLNTGTVTSSQRETSTSRDQRNGINATGRLQWRGEQGSSFMLQPMVIYSASESARSSKLEQFVGTAPYDHSDGSGESNFAMGRLNAEWKQQIADAGRMELRANLGTNRSNADSVRFDRDAAGTVLHTREDHTDTRDNSLTLGGKYTALLDGEQSLVSGLEVESNQREDNGRTLYDGAPLLTDTGDNLKARVTRVAAYAQDEWTLNPNWSAHAGLRWEGIRTRSNGFDIGTGLQEDVKNDSSVWTPLLHAVWKPDPKGNDQVRMSLTRTYRQPSLQSLIARPSINSRAPLPGGNDPTSPDRVGNPDLKPELATGLDVAFERYIGNGGLLSANVFYRQISDYMRSVTSLQSVAYSPTPRYVSRTENVGDAVTQGVELEARFRLNDAIEGAPRIDVRMNASFFHSRVKEVPGPDNRLDQQPDGTANLGLDYKFAGLPLSIGGNLNWTPGYTTRISEVQWAEYKSKLAGDAFALWTISPATQLRLSASNFAPRDYVTGSRFEDASLRDVSETTQPTYINWQLRLEMRL
ncbi:MAG TPA: TonB-dependent receptor [Rhizobacter sp.]|nr:TonB-dependent receptor [Rhizobacter sp.]